MNPEISIITVTMNHLPLLKEMLYSLFVSCKPATSFELILVDNCSTDGTIEYVREAYPSVHIIENTEINGFAKNNNTGAAQAKGRFILILNPDIILTDGAIDTLYQYLKNNPSAGIVAPRLLNQDGSIQLSARHFMSVKFLLCRIFTNGKDDTNNPVVQEYLMPDISDDQPSEVDWCLGAALLFEKSFYQQLGGFDEKFFLYVEDADICQRCWFAGKKVIYLPQSQMIHAHQRTSAHLSKKTIMHLKSHFYFLRKNRFKIERVPTK
ncbi:N-acetylglucosaminyl-diphospho-decaprenol L-rhamnosyltransferase [Parabacteroides sp. PF5-5]|uniref:glycosyltransferase family 2 protein n=1 Tax=unclassified Parabacteroides TaxID=2649774 RepID=UPI00247409C7|nr:MULTISPECIES: glycosyltransferase family 2 protein [unclassified Parabacteroides]MDH6306150.1 N-acetylglucosaminyl-diphospho-decaprenol L-rhamnosyltransferase [Parabacteroides sp. PH5-39]MDH6317109.1 N-acetylglucosaminyl-diphospho-decaprenol L-rhamnosyltransferase [Parabacteroides sp. PF5-13]MDH6320862.1 N-acetylglucosaminyl-diphospho-decaprenol L-rhamnosyltransferase [Parabacteroides sp. PH5-13]MDH6324593.1 N-acetylglucosaminyl-diphospho-decaprenol L-rhamnosyltransferase [Parabacteroides sp